MSGRSGDLAFEVRLSQRTPWFLYLLTNNFLMPLHRPTVEGSNESWTRPGRMVGNGAYRLVSQVINGPIGLERNPHHPEVGAIRVPRVTYFPVRERNAVTARYLAGDLDITEGFQIDDYQRLRGELHEGEVRLAPYVGTVMLGFHGSRAPFDSVPLRQALNMAIDREILTGKLLDGLFLPAYNVVPPLQGYAPALPEWATWTAERRHARARELYAQAGYSKQRPLRVDLAYPAVGADATTYARGR